MRLDRERMLLQAFDLLTLRPKYHVKWSEPGWATTEIEGGLSWILDGVSDSVFTEVWVELAGRPGREDISQLVAELWWRSHRDDVLSNGPEGRVLPEFIQHWIEETQ